MAVGAALWGPEVPTPLHRYASFYFCSARPASPGMPLSWPKESSQRIRCAGPLSGITPVAPEVRACFTLCHGKYLWFEKKSGIGLDRGRHFLDQKKVTKDCRCAGLFCP